MVVAGRLLRDRHDHRAEARAARSAVRLWLFLGCAIVSFECLAKAIRTAIPLGLAYAIWTGIGAVGAVIVGVVAFDDPLGPVRAALLFVLVAAMVGLKLSGDSKRRAAPQAAAGEFSSPINASTRALMAS